MLRYVPPALAAAVALGVLAVPLPAKPAQPAKDGGAAVVYRGATIHTGTGEKPLADAALVVRDGKILDVGSIVTVRIPPGSEFVDLKGTVIIPGLVDTHSHIGVWSRPGVPANADLSETSGPVQPGVRAIDAINPDDPGIRMALAGGITTANIMPGSANVIGGSTLYVKIRGGSVEQMQILGVIGDRWEHLGGLKMANGENPKNYGKTRQQAPFTRMKVAALQRETFVKAREYKQKLDQARVPAPAHKDVTFPKPDRDVTLEPLVEVLEKRRTVHFHCHRADDILTAVRLAEEFGFELVLQHATEGYRVADILAKKKIPVSLTLIDAPGGKAETMGLLEENAAILEKAGVPVAINTDDSITESRFFLHTGAIAVRGGMSEAGALKAMTLTPARLMHLDHRVGSLEKGKDADFVVLSGPPFSTYTRVKQTFIEGKKVFDEDNDRAYRDGGFMLAAGEKLPPVAAAKAAKSVPAPAFNSNKNPDSPKRTIVLAGRIHTATGPPIERGAILIEGGKVAAIMSEAEVKIPADAAVITAAEVTPGLIDPFCVAGLTGAWNIPADQDQDELSDPNQAELRVLDGFNPHEPLLDFLQANGVTVVHTTPGRQNVIAGQSGVFRTDGTTAESAALKPVAGILVNLGEVPKTAYKGKSPDSRMGTAALVRKSFAEAQEWRLKNILPGGPPGPAPVPGNPKLAALVPAVAGEIPVYFAAHRKDDIQTALRIAAEFKLKPVIALGTEAYRMIPELKKAGVPVVVHPTMQRAGSSMETLHSFTGNAATLHAAGVPLTIGTGFEGYVPKVRVLRHEVALAVGAGGLDPAAALRAVTIDAAKLLGIEKEYGSIEKGKVADLVLYDGDPFEHATHVTRTIMGGRVVYDRAEYLKLPFERRILPIVSGGPGAGCCLTGW